VTLVIPAADRACDSRSVRRRMWSVLVVDGERIEGRPSLHFSEGCAAAEAADRLSTLTGQRTSALRCTAFDWSIGFRQLFICHVSVDSASLSDPWVAMSWPLGRYPLRDAVVLGSPQSAARWIGEQVRLGGLHMTPCRFEAVSHGNGRPRVGTAVRAYVHRCGYADSRRCSTARSHFSDRAPDFAAPSSFSSRTTSAPAKSAVGYRSAMTSA
jgi:hypothetical protein